MLASADPKQQQQQPDDSWSVPCWPNDADDPLEPPAEELENMFRLLEQGGVLELQWKCPGRRLPSPVTASGGGAASGDANAEQTTPEKETPTKNKDFDFMDEVATPTMRVRAQNATPKGSAKKKTANFAGVIDAMKKHGRITQPAAAAQPSTPSGSNASSTAAAAASSSSASTGGAAAKPEQG